MKVLYIIAVVIFGSLFISCKKDKLEGDKSVLIGTWEWAYTEHYYSYCNPPSQFEILTPQTENKSVTINFYSNGKLSFNDEKMDRIVFAHWESKINEIPRREFRFGIRLNNDSDAFIGGWVGADTLTLTGDYIKEPFEDISCDGCCSYVNYFLKQ